MMFSAATLLLTAMGQSASGNAGRADEQRRLEACIAKLDESPEEAYEDGLAWVGEGGRPFAKQCTALALVELGHAAEGAIRLEELANADDGGSLAQRIIYLTQSGNAWLIAGEPEAALVTLNNAIRISPIDPNLNADRAAAYMQLYRWNSALADLNIALNALPRDTGILKMRAETRLNLSDYEGAMNDINDAMAVDRTDITTLVLRGHVREAMRNAGIASSAQPEPERIGDGG